MSRTHELLAARLGPAAAAAHLELAKVVADRSQLPVVFPGLPRRHGRAAAGAGVVQVGEARIDLGAFRTCDLVAAFVLSAAGADDGELFDLYQHGDIEERTMLLRALHVLPIGPITVRMFGEVQRTNMLVHVEAALCDGDLFARTWGQPGFLTDVANRVLLKLAFLDLPLGRCLGAERHANADLSAMLQDLATEREAAGRAVWRDTSRLIGLAPTAGTAARLVGGLEHGDDGVRRAAAEGLLALGRKELFAFAQERLPREPRADIRAVLLRCRA